MIENEFRVDLVLHGGRIHVLDEEDTRAEALAVRDDRIVAVGTDREIDALIGTQTQVVDLDGRTVIPGINDSHLHASWLGGMWPRTVFGSGGEPDTGPLVRTRDERRAALLRAGELFASWGITSYTEPGIGPGEDEGPTGSFDSEVLELYRELDAEGLLRARVNLLLLFGLIDGPASTEAILTGIAHADTAVRDPERFRIAGVKVFGDGIPPMRGAFIHGRYTDGSHGDLLLDGAGDDEKVRNLHRVIRAAHDAGLQVAVHATGDRTIDTVIDAVAAADASSPADLRHYVVHADMLRPERIPTLVREGMGVTMQAGIAAMTGQWATAAFEPDAVPSLWPMRELLEAGVPFTLSSDAPILAPDWRQEIAAADRLLGPADDPRARAHELLRRYTAIPAWQDHAEAWKGTLEVGKVADLVVLTADPDDTGAAGLGEVGIDQTYLGGEVIYDAALSPAPAPTP